MKLSEARAAYVEKSPESKPLDNRRIKTYLKAELRKRAEALIGDSWQTITDNYSTDFKFWGSPNTGWVELYLKDSTVCYGFGAIQRPPMRIGFRQRDLFQADS